MRSLRLLSQAPSYSRRLFSTSVARDASWGFIGLGRMGYPMARNLRKGVPESDSVYVFDVNSAAAESLKNEVPGITIAKDVNEVAENSDTVITMLPEPRHVQSVFANFLSNPLVPSSSSTQQKLFIDCSTIGPTTSREVGDAVRNSYLKGEFVDAPVSGGVVGAEAGTLTFMVGANSGLEERLEAVLSLMGKRILHCGKPGAGIIGKLANNYLLAMENIATAEAMNFGIKLGLEPQTLKNLINVSTGKCWSSEINNPVDKCVKDYTGGFGISLMKKDLKLAIEAAQKGDVKLAMGEPALRVYETVEKDPSCEGRDFSVVYRWLGGREDK